MNVTLQQSHDYCASIARSRARNFYYGMKLTPEPKRAAMYAIYAWMRQADDLADEPGDEQAKITELERFRETTIQAVEHDKVPEVQLLGVWPAFIDTVHRYDIPRQYLHDVIDGQLMDMKLHRYQTFEQLYGYCYKVASVVGLTCIQIWGYDGGESTRQLAEWRGIAFQLTNILRDIREDASRNRMYLPADYFGDFGASPGMFSFGPQPIVMMGIYRILDQTDEYYQKSQPLDQLIHPDGRACLWAMTRIYRGIFDKIRQNPASVLNDKRICLSTMRKTWIALRARGKAAAR